MGTHRRQPYQLPHVYDCHDFDRHLRNYIKRGRLGFHRLVSSCAVTLRIPPSAPRAAPMYADKRAISTWLYNISFSATCGPLSYIIPAEIFDTHTRSKGVSIAACVSFAFNTMIGQITDPAIKDIGWKYYLIFVIFNFSNAVFFWLTLPETKLLPLEEMNYLFKNAPWIIPGSDKSSYTADLSGDLERRAGEILQKGAHDDHEHEHVENEKL